MEQRGAFDYILLETTGLADPGRIAPLFWLDDGLGATIYLDGVVTVVDALNVLKSLDEDPPAASENESRGASIDHDTGDEKHMTTAHLQISHADRIIINKIDLVDKNQADAVEARIRSINGLAGIIRTERANLPSLKGTILDLHAYEGLGEIDWEKGGHSHLDPVS